MAITARRNGALRKPGAGGLSTLLRAAGAGGLVTRGRRVPPFGLDLGAALLPRGRFTGAPTVSCVPVFFLVFFLSGIVAHVRQKVDSGLGL